ncbi:MAG: hypothetical protein R3281_18520, partial [Balneolaceae bacterium]|nr:hypothetical protein [Balneolaceae bacterium]
STVNIASRLVDLASENEIILSKTVSRMLDQQHSSTESGLHFQAEDLEVTLRGFENEQFQIKSVALKGNALRPAV